MAADFGLAAAWALVGLNALLFAGFILSLLAASTALSQPSGTTACSGNDIMSMLRRDRPGAMETLLAESDAIPNGQGQLWRIEATGLAPSWLLGTMHSPDPRIARLEGAVEAAFAASTTVIVENTDAHDSDRMREQMMAQRATTVLADRTIEDLLPPESVEPVRQAAQGYGIPWEAARQMQPWLLAASLSRPLCDARAAASGQDVLDSLIIRRAKDAGKAVIGLETVAEQFTAIASLPLSFQIAALSDLVAMPYPPEDVMETLKLLYLDGQNAMMLPLMRLLSPSQDGHGQAGFQQRVIHDRNRVMVGRADAVLRKGGAFMAVGALHLPGEEGVIELLRQRGFTVEPVAE